MANYYVPAKYTVTETFIFGGNDFYRSSVNPSPGLDYYSLVGGIYETEDHEKYDELREAGIFDTVVYDPSVCSYSVSLSNYKDSWYYNDSLYFDHYHYIFGGRLVKENEPTTYYKRRLGCIYHKVTQTIHSTNENEYESIFIDYGKDYDSSGITVTVGYGTHETVLYDSRSAKVNRGPYFITPRYYPLKNGVKNVGSADPFTVTVTTTHEIIHVIPSAEYESVMAALSTSENVSIEWLIDDNIPYIDGVPKTIGSIADINDEWVITDGIPYRLDFPSLKASRDVKHDWYIDDDIPFKGGFPELHESEKFDIRDEWVASETVNTFGGHRFLKLSYKLFIHWNGTAMTVETNIPEAFKRSTHLYVNNANFGKEVWMVINTEIPQCPFQCMMSFGGDIAKFYNTCSYIAPTFYNYRTSGTGSVTRKLDFTPDKLDSNFYSKSELNTLFYDDKKHIERPNNYAVEARVTFNTASGGSLPTDNAEVVVDIDIVFAIEEDNEERWQSMWELYPTHLTEYFYYDGTLPYRLDFPPLNESIPGTDIWVIDDDIPYRIEFPALHESNGGYSGWLQNTGYEPYRPWPNHKTIFQSVQPVTVPEVDWTRSMSQTFEYFEVDPKSWNDVKQITTVISSSLTRETDSEMRGHASIDLSEPLDEIYIRTYLKVKQDGFTHRFCLGTFLYMMSSDSYNGVRHSYTMSGYTPLIELREKLPPLGYNITGVTGEVDGKVAPLITDEISRLITQYTRLKLNNRVQIKKPLLNNFVAGTSDTLLGVVNSILNASSLQEYSLTVDERGAICIKEAITVYNERHVFEYTDDNSSILLPSLDLTLDLSSIPNVLEVIYVGDANKDIGAVRVVVRNDDPNSIVSTVSRGREVWARTSINNIGTYSTKSEVTKASITEQVTAQAYRLLEAASTIRKTIQYSHGYCNVKVGDTVLFNYRRAGFMGIKAKVVSQTIQCKPGCQVDEMAIYTKKLWNRIRN